MAGVTTFALQGENAAEYRAQVLWDLDEQVQNLRKAVESELPTDEIRARFHEVADTVGELEALGSWDELRGPYRCIEVVADSDVLRNRLTRTISNAGDVGSGPLTEYRRRQVRLAAAALKLLEEQVEVEAVPA